MWKIATTIVIASLLTACNPGYEDKTADYSVIPNELKDCKFYSVFDGMNSITVVRCPNSQTSTTWLQRSGKVTTSHTAVVIDGVAYEPKDTASRQK